MQISFKTNQSAIHPFIVKNKKFNRLFKETAKNSITEINNLHLKQALFKE